MISVVIPAAQAARDLAGLLPALVPAVVSGLVREAILVDPAPDGAMLAICEDSGAGLAPDLAAALERARGELILALPPALRLRPGWEESLRRHLESGGGPALVCAAPPSLIERLTGPRLAGVLLPADRARERKPADLAGLRRRLGRAALLT
ncbi:cell wall biosynthesis glycosyltransferase [Phenylobacterium sp.]|uniref:cell wall biosynthesis glycosyltransferase n=1 Tax=Phenylobacterium sp. TaxID=1871053 RepID=UPI0035B2F42A